MAIASARYAKYHHPDILTLKRLQAHHIPVLKTEDWGNLVLGSARRDPIEDRLHLFLARLPLAIELLEAVVGHLLLGNLDEQLGAVRIAGQDQSRHLSNLFEVQDVAEILGRLLAF